jgi:predicted MFS family arabinose efflux permease
MTSDVTQTPKAGSATPRLLSASAQTLLRRTARQPSAASAQQLTRGVTLLFAVTCGLAVANVYFAQPLLESMADSLSVAPGTIGIVVTATQIGYALGLLFIVPLGDLLNRRLLIVGQMLLSAMALVAACVAQEFGLFLAAMMSVGLLAVVVQVLVAYTAALATPAQRGQAVGTVTSGIVLGILLARFVSGILADLAGWRAVYGVSAVLMVLMAGLLIRSMPHQTSPQVTSSYRQLITSVFRLFVTERQLRVRGVLALLVFAAFSVLWTSMVLPLSAPPYSLSHTQIGLFGLAGIAGALAASRAGRWADRGLGQTVTGIALTLLTLSWVATGFAQSSLLALVLGVVVLDFAVQAVHVTNQSLILAARPDAQSRLIGAYMMFYSFGSALGAIAATQVFAFWGWFAVCALGAFFSGLALIVWGLTRKLP